MVKQKPQKKPPREETSLKEAVKLGWWQPEEDLMKQPFIAIKSLGVVIPREEIKWQ